MQLTTSFIVYLEKVKYLLPCRRRDTETHALNAIRTLTLRARHIERRDRWVDIPAAILIHHYDRLQTSSGRKHRADTGSIPSINTPTEYPRRAEYPPHQPARAIGPKKHAAVKAMNSVVIISSPSVY